MKLLHDTEFSGRFEAFWGTWRGRKGDFECLCPLGTQQHGSKQTIEHFEREIRDLEISFCTHTSTEGHKLKQKAGTHNIFTGKSERGLGEVKVHHHQGDGCSHLLLF